MTVRSESGQVDVIESARAAQADGSSFAGFDHGKKKMTKFVSASIVLLIGLSFVAAVADEADKPRSKSSLSGRVTFRGQPVEGRIFVYTDDRQFFGCLIDEGGKYVIKNPRRGTFRVTVEGRNVPDRYSHVDNGLKVQILPGSNAIDVDLTSAP